MIPCFEGIGVVLWQKWSCLENKGTEVRILTQSFAYLAISFPAGIGLVLSFYAIGWVCRYGTRSTLYEKEKTPILKTLSQMPGVLVVHTCRPPPSLVIQTELKSTRMAILIIVDTCYRVVVIGFTLVRCIIYQHHLLDNKTAWTIHTPLRRLLLCGGFNPNLLPNICVACWVWLRTPLSNEFLQTVYIQIESTWLGFGHSHTWL